ncbi:MAG TPA: cytochrome c biogenesis heme-transporting ATPase CcmA [Pseudomonadales bacterium]|nr:cytochrome c biogenesis heme-transporting ATPase CcmA [Pseudomonadales bacterium]
MTQPTLEARQLSCTRDDRSLFDALSFTIASGTIVQVEGPNGAGKTTLLRILCGLMQGFNGNVLYEGKDIQEYRDDWAQAQLYLGHLPGIKLQLNALENLRWILALTEGAGAEDDALFHALANVGLSGFEDVPCNALSAGQKRRVALARLYLQKKPVWILDEPFTAIDKKGVARLEAHLMAHAKQGGIVILTTHQDLSFADVQTIRLG